VKYTDMTAEVREEALDICITAVEKYATDMEKCTQVCVGVCMQSETQGELSAVGEHARTGWLLRHRHACRRCVLSVLVCRLSVADDQGSDGQEVWVTLACHRGKGLRV
jgi:hypothetical protein